MEFEFDPEKSKANKRKHGVSLDEAKQIWQESYLEVTARTVDELRVLAIGGIGGRLYACIYTLRGDRIRLISCRRARGKEVQLYHEYFQEKAGEGEADGG